MTKNKPRKQFKLLALLVLVGVLLIGAVVYFFLIPRYDVSIKDATVKSNSTKDGIKHVSAMLDVGCNVTQVSDQLNCQKPTVTGDYRGNRDFTVSATDKATNFKTEDGKISFTPEQVSLKAVVVRSEPVKGPVSKQYEIVARSSNDKEVVAYTLTINTNFTENDLKLINKDPTAEGIKTAVEKISTVKDVCITTEANDPNGKLGKPGTYFIKIVFVDMRAPAISQIFDESLGNLRPAKDSCEKGADAGGSVEVFRNKNDADSRKHELDALAGGFFDSGTAKVVNKTVIRTSSELKASQQKELEQQLLDVLTK